MPTVRGSHRSIGIVQRRFFVLEKDGLGKGTARLIQFRQRFQDRAGADPHFRFNAENRA